MKFLNEFRLSWCNPTFQLNTHHLPIKEGFKEAAEKFQQEAGVEPAVELFTLENRILIRDAVQNGRIQEATHLVNQLHPELLDNDRYLFFHLQQLHLIELIRLVNLSPPMLYLTGNILTPNLAPQCWPNRRGFGLCSVPDVRGRGEQPWSVERTGKNTCPIGLWETTEQSLFRPLRAVASHCESITGIYHS